MPIFIQVPTVFPTDYVDEDDLGAILVTRDMAETAATAVRYGWRGMVGGYHESEWSIARDLMLAGF